MRLALPLAVLVVVLLAAYATAPPVALADAPTVAAAADSTEWQNLQVLPDTLARPELIGIMRGFAVSLGVRCEHCHAAGADGELDFPSDANPHKDIARDMMRMTRTLNQQTLPAIEGLHPAEGMRVTCYTCHRGATTPVTELPPREDG